MTVVADQTTGPSVVETSAGFGIATSTAQKAPAHLKAEGLIRAEVGPGSFVAKRPAAEPPA
ncbi:GntR family transcriptional regulator [Streptomyces puniciscabiei]